VINHPATCKSLTGPFHMRSPEDAAPQRIRNSAPVRETVAFLLNRARVAAGGRELRGMAARMGLPHY